MNSSMPYLWKKQQVCEALDISITTLNRLVKSREIRAVKFGRIIRFDPKDISEFVVRKKYLRRKAEGTL